MFVLQYLLLNAVCCSLVNKNTAPGQKDWDSDDSVWTRIIKLGKDISVFDPQFLLKVCEHFMWMMQLRDFFICMKHLGNFKQLLIQVAVYTRQELNIRITANFLLALAAHQTTTKPHVRRYYCAAVQLPSDWLEVARIYSTVSVSERRLFDGMWTYEFCLKSVLLVCFQCFSNVLPTCLKKAMVDKFKQFTEYQLAKYNTRKHRCKHNRSRRKKKVHTNSILRFPFIYFQRRCFCKY